MNGFHPMTPQSTNPFTIMKTILSALLLATCSPCFAQPPATVAPPSPPAVDPSVEHTLIRICREQIKAVEAYLAANPKADSRDKVLNELVVQYGGLAVLYRHVVARDKKSDDEHRRLDALEREYAYLTKVENPDLQSVCKNILNRIDIVRKGLRATLEEHKQAQAIFDQGKQDFPKLTDDSIFCYQESELKRPCVGEGMPIQFTALDGSQVDSAALKGKVVVVYSWESSQRESLEALPGLKAMYQKFHDKGLEVLGIPWDKDEAALRDFIKKENIPWPQAFDGKGRKNAVAVKYGLNTVLLHYIIGRDGKVADYEVSDSSKLEAKVAELLK